VELVEPVAGVTVKTLRLLQLQDQERSIQAVVAVALPTQHQVQVVRES
jgi:hypothetical protein